MSIYASVANTQKLTTGNLKTGRKRSRERVLMVLDALKEYPLLAGAAAKAGIHHKTPLRTG